MITVILCLLVVLIGVALVFSGYYLREITDKLTPRIKHEEQQEIKERPRTYEDQVYDMLKFNPLIPKGGKK